MQVLIIIGNIVMVLIVCLSLIAIITVLVYRKLFESKVHRQLQRIVFNKYTSRKELEKDIKEVYDGYEVAKREKGWYGNE